MATRLDSEDSARELALEMKRPGRTRPVVVVTIASGRTEPYVDVAEMEDAVDGLCDVYVLPSGPASWAFAAALPGGRQVYGGAARVYGTDLAWLDDQYRSQLRFAYAPSDRDRVTELLISDALASVHAGRTRLGRPDDHGGVPAEGSIIGVSGGRGLVVLDSGGKALPAAVRPELVVPGVAVEQLFVKGQRVRGLYHSDANRLDVSPRYRQSPAEAFAGVEPNTVLLGQVARIHASSVTITLLPGVDVCAPGGDLLSEGEDLAGLLSIGEVVPIEVTEVTDGVPSSVTLLTQEYLSLAEPICILQDGPGWLVPPEQSVPTDDPVDTSAVIEGVLVEPDESDPAVAALVAENDDLLRRLSRAEHDLKQARHELGQAKTSARTARQRARQAEKESLGGRARRTDRNTQLFADPAEQLRFEVYLAWAERTTPADKQAYPWREFTTGGQFLTTLTEVEGIERDKVVEVVADVVSGRADKAGARQLHKLRSGEGAHNPVVTREDGATCWRAYLQTNTPSARRLHFWRLPDGSIEFSSVRLHDDMRP